MTKKELSKISQKIESLTMRIYNDSKTNEALETYYNELSEIDLTLRNLVQFWNADNGKSRSPQKILAARENGKKGGRPKKNKTESI